jgi:hypothetical protein
MVRPSSPTAEAEDLKSLKSGFESQEGHQCSFATLRTCKRVAVLTEKIPPVAHRSEHGSYKAVVVGSIPTRRTMPS